MKDQDARADIKAWKLPKRRDVASIARESKPGPERKLIG